MLGGRLGQGEGYRGLGGDDDYPVVIINWVHYLGLPGRSISQILGTFSRFSEIFLAEREGGSLGDPPGP